MADPATEAAHSTQLAVKRLVDRIADKQVDQAEQRLTTRHSLNVPVTIRTGYGVFQAWANEISYEGIGLLTNKPLLPNSTIVVDLRPAVGYSCRARVQLAHFQKLLGGVYRTGGRFVFAKRDEPA